MKLNTLIRGGAATAVPAVFAVDGEGEPPKTARTARTATANTPERGEWPNEQPQEPQQPQQPQHPENWHGFTLAELQRAAGDDADLLSDPDTLEAFAFALREEREVARGIAPARYTAVAFCEGCGAIAAPPHQHGERLAVCPWCERRKAGQSRPKPFPLLGHDQTAIQPFSESLRPVDWQGIDERMEGHGGGYIDHTKPRPYPARKEGGSSG